MYIDFCKYEGAANDFIMIADEKAKIEAQLNPQKVAELCHRRKGIGADGLILLQKSVGYNFKMVYYNSDGNKSSMCGNGGRCIMAFANRCGWVSDTAVFWAVDGEHNCFIKENLVHLQMQNVANWEKINEDWLLNTGSPHYIKVVKTLQNVNIFAEGQLIRYHHRFEKEGVNVNFMQLTDDILTVATYERGVEAETWACGTGVTACGIVAALLWAKKSPIVFLTKGGRLKVSFVYKNNCFTDIWLIGEANFVYSGQLSI